MQSVSEDVKCPNCGEKRLFYAEGDRLKGIIVGDYVHEEFLNMHYGKSYNCYTCGYQWNVKTSI